MTSRGDLRQQLTRKFINMIKEGRPLTHLLRDISQFWFKSFATSRVASDHDRFEPALRYIAQKMGLGGSRKSTIDQQK